MRRAPILLAVAAFAAASLVVLPARAPAALAAGATITVTTLSDVRSPGNGFCSLAEAITAANANGGDANTDCADGSGSGTDTIVFANGGTITLSAGLPDVLGDTDINGNASITIDGTGSFQVIRFISGTSTIEHLAIKGGSAQFGGAISNGTNLTVRFVTVSDSTAQFGGGIHNNGSMTIDASTIVGNTATGVGGGVFNENSLQIRRSTITGNAAPQGAGIYAQDDLLAQHVTIVGNTAPTSGGGGIRQVAGIVQADNSIIAGNAGGQLVGTIGSVANVVASSATGIVDTVLRDNGGETKTLMIPKGSTALGGGNASVCGVVPIDQRGFARPATDCDRGALQRDRIAPTVTSGPKTVLRGGVELSGTSLRGQITWAGTDTGTEIRSYTLSRSVNGGSWTTVASGLTGTARNVTLANGSTYRFRVRAVDLDGNVSVWRYGPTFKARLVQQSSSAVTFSSGWTTVVSTKYSGGSTRYAKSIGRSVKITFTGRSISLVTTYRNSAPSFVVTIDGVVQGSMGLLPATTTTYRVQGPTWNFSGSTTHTLKLTTGSATRLDIDAFAILK